jgi:hypothetical protein
MAISKSPWQEIRQNGEQPVGCCKMQENCKVTFSRRVSRIRGIVILSEAKDLDGMQGFAPSYEILRCAQQ